MRHLHARTSRVVLRKPALMAAALLEPLEARRLLATYYVSPGGSDVAPGTSITAPWKSINRVNQQVLRAGDQVLFEGGKSFSGSLKLNYGESGTATNRINFSTYGAGRATISSGAHNGLWVPNGGGVNVSNLRFVGNGMYNNTSFGIFFHVDMANKTVSGVSINNVEVFGYGREGIRINASGADSAINDVAVTNTDSHDNLWGGLKASTHRISGMKNYIIDRVRAWNNYGDRNHTGVTGNGIMLEGVAGARVSYCVAYDNGKDGAAPVGIWAAMGERITIEYCESYNNSTRTTTDGGGFDFDWDVKNSVMQYNYSHNNAGPGYILAAGSHVNHGNVIRYNISENDGRKNGRAGIQLWGNITDASIYNNVIYITPAGNSNTAALFVHDTSSGGKRPRNVKFFNNVFYTTGGVKIINVTKSVALYADMQFSGNCYYSGGGAFKIQWGADTYSTLAAWQDATGKEMSPAAMLAAPVPAARFLATTTVTTGTISGVVYSDANKNGVFDAGDTALSNRKIFIDANANGKHDAGELYAHSNASGVYTFPNLPVGSYRIRRPDVPSGYYLTTPISALNAVVVAAGQTTTMDIGAAAGVPGTTPTGITGSISGVVFNDANADGAFDSGEARLSARKVYIDANGNGKLDSDEKYVHSNANGVYTFSNIAPGSYRIRRADMPGGYYLTTPISVLNGITVAAGQAVALNIGAANGTPTTPTSPPPPPPPSNPSPPPTTNPTGRTGYMGDPKFVAAGQGGTFGDATKLRNLTAYKLQSASPLINRGVSHPGPLASVTVDFWGNTLPKGGRYDTGAHELA